MMTCSQFKERLDAYIGGDLPAEEATAVKRHAGTCGDCAREFARALRVVDLVEELPRWIEPPTDLWPGIETRMGRGGRVERGSFGRPLRTWIAAAAVVAAAAAAVLVAYSVGRHQAPVTAVELQPTPQRPLAVRARAGSMDAVEAEFLEARVELLAALEQRRDRLSPETIETVFSNLVVIDEAIDRISAALGDDPGNPMLAGQLTRAYQLQIELLRRANRLPAEI